MKSSDIKNLISAFFVSLNNQNFDELTHHLSSDVVFHFPGITPLTGPHKVIQLLKIIYRQYSDLVFTLTDTIVENDRAIAVWKNEGTDHNGTHYKNEGTTVFRFKNGKLNYMSDYFKDTSFIDK
jgi:ketosteroid isomerase-like protein